MNISRLDFSHFLEEQSPLLNLETISAYYKEIFLSYFDFDQKKLEKFFHPDNLVIAPLWTKLKDYYSFNPKDSIRYLTILEYLTLAIFFHEETINPDLGKEEQVKKILFGDLLIVLSIQEINLLPVEHSRVFYQHFKSIFYKKIVSHIKDKGETYNYLKFILFLDHYLKVGISPIAPLSNEIESSYLRFISILDMKDTVLLDQDLESQFLPIAKIFTDLKPVDKERLKILA